MRRSVWGFLFLAGALFWLVQGGEVPAQSKKKQTGAVVTIDGLKSQTFDYWKQEKAEGRELYRFSFPAAPNDKAKMNANLIIIPVRGNDEALIDRWKSMFETPKTGKLDAQVRDLKAAGANMKLLDVYGTYLKKVNLDDPDDKAEKLERFRMASVLFQTNQGKYQIRLLGSSLTVGVILPDLNDWLKGFKK